MCLIMTTERAVDSPGTALIKSPVIGEDRITLLGLNSLVDQSSLGFLEVEAFGRFDRRDSMIKCFVMEACIIQ